MTRSQDGDLVAAPRQLFGNALNVKLHTCPVWQVVEQADQDLECIGTLAVCS
jgi:hypothetical protein